jgi:hypothetical protein
VGREAVHDVDFICRGVERDTEGKIKCAVPTPRSTKGVHLDPVGAVHLDLVGFVVGHKDGAVGTHCKTSGASKLAAPDTQLKGLPQILHPESVNATHRAATHENHIVRAHRHADRLQQPAPRTQQCSLSVVLEEPVSRGLHHVDKAVPIAGNGRRRAQVFSHRRKVPIRHHSAR